MSVDKNAIETDDIKLELDNTEKSEEQQSIKKKEIEEREAKNEECEDLIKKINKEKEAEIKALERKKEKDETERVIKEVETEHIKSVWWRILLSLLGALSPIKKYKIKAEKYKIEAEKIKLARIIFSKSQNNNRTKEDDEYIWNKIQEYTTKSTEITKKAPKSEILEQAGQTKKAKGGAEETTKNQDKEKNREQDNEVKTR
jgi:hypothetical protein